MKKLLGRMIVGSYVAALREGNPVPFMRLAVVLAMVAVLLMIVNVTIWRINNPQATVQVSVSGDLSQEIKLWQSGCINDVRMDDQDNWQPIPGKQHQIGDPFILYHMYGLSSFHLFKAPQVDGSIGRMVGHIRTSISQEYGLIIDVKLPYPADPMCEY